MYVSVSQMELRRSRWTERDCLTILSAIRKFAYLWNCRDRFSKRAKRRVVLAVDGDAPGKALEYELARRIGRAKCWRVVWPTLIGDVETKDANEVLVQGGPELLREVLDAAEPLPIRSLYDISAFQDQTLALYEGRIKRGVSTGWYELDQVLRIRPGGTFGDYGSPKRGEKQLS